MSSVAIVYHSGYGHTAVVAEAVAEGVRAAGGTPDLVRIEDAGQDMGPLIERATGADAIIFGAPTYMGGASAPMKAFIDASSKPWYTRDWKDKLAGGFTNSGGYSGDKLQTLMSFAVLAAQHGMIWVSQAELSEHQNGNGDAGADKVNRMVSSLGVMAQSDNASPEVTPPEGDKKTARLYGERIARAAQRWTAGAHRANQDAVLVPELEIA